MRRATRIFLYRISIFLFAILIFYIFLSCWAAYSMEGFQGLIETTYETNSKIKVLTYATDMKPTLGILLETLKKNNYSYEVVGWGKPWTGFRNRMIEYLAAVKSYKEKAGEDKLVVVIDGYDCLSIKDSESTYERYMKRERHYIPVMFGAEIICLGNCNKQIEDWYEYHELYGGKEGIRKMTKAMGDMLVSVKPVFLNAGMLIGPAGHLEKMYTGMLDLKIDDDQVAAGTYAVNNMDDIDLDIEEAIFRNKPGDKRENYILNEGKPEGPSFLHFPGHGGDNNSIIIDIYNRYI